MASRKVVSPRGQAAGRDINNDDAPRNSIQSIAGSINIVGNSGTTTIHISTRRPVIRNTIQPGEEHISAAQRFAIQKLRLEWIELHNAIKVKKLTHASAWATINKKAGSTSYHLIPRSKYDEIVAHIKRQMAILRAMPSAPSKDDAWRAKRIGSIKARCINQLGDPYAYRDYIRKNFQAESLTDLSTTELQKTYSHIMERRAVSAK